jgi:cell division protein ZapA (FtsZ GTPase activity inhibitor)
MNSKIKNLTLSIDNYKYTIKCSEDKSKAIIETAKKLTKSIQDIQSAKPNLSKEQVITMAAIKICTSEASINNTKNSSEEFEIINEKIVNLMLI